jgi:7,8-dihydroneopterin aldolase/epimerase/oxygenase
MTDRLSVIGMQFSGRHGVLPNEKLEAQPFEVDLVLHTELRAAGASDDLADTTDYGSLFDLTAAIVEGWSFDLIEALAASIARAVLAATDPALVEAVEVRVRKPKAPLSGAFKTVEVGILRRRDDAAPDR